MARHIVRLGSLGELYIADWQGSLHRRQRVIVRTELGVQAGEIVGPVSHRGSASYEDAKATILRVATEEDELLIGRLERHKRNAVEACRRELEQSGSSATLLDVDQLFDGGTLVMHFLGPVDDLAQSITGKVAQQYEAVVRTRHFARLLRDGCGPECGTEDAAGCGGGCASCVIKCH